MISVDELARAINSTLLQPTATRSDVEKLCVEARQYAFGSVCVNGSRVVQAQALLEESGVRVATVVGYPLGAMDADAKRYEAEVAIDNGAQEIEVVLNLGWLKEGNDRGLLRELHDVMEVAEGRTIKAVLEMAFLSNEEKVRAGRLVLEAGIHWIKTATGFGPVGATLDDVRMLRKAIGAEWDWEAAGNILDTPTALAALEAGATRLGTSAGAAIVCGLHSLQC